MCTSENGLKKNSWWKPHLVPNPRPCAHYDTKTNKKGNISYSRPKEASLWSKIEASLEGRGPGGKPVRRGGGGSHDVGRTVNTNNEVLRANLALRELLTSDMDHVVASVGVNVGEGVLANGGDKLLVEVHPDLTEGVFLGLLNVDDEVSGSVGDRDVVVDELTRANVAGYSLGVGQSKGANSDFTEISTISRGADAASSARGLASVLAVARISDGAKGDLVVAATISMNSNMPSMITRGSNVESGIGAQGSVLVVVTEDGGTLILTNIKITVSIGNGTRCHADTDRVGSRATESVVVPGEEFDESMVTSSKRHGGSLGLAVITSVSRLARANGTTAESTHRAAVRAAISDGSSEGEAAAVGVGASVSPNSNIPVTSSSVDNGQGRGGSHGTVSIIELQLSGNSTTTKVEIQISGGRSVLLGESEGQGGVGVRKVDTKILPSALLNRARVRGVESEGLHSGRAISTRITSIALTLSSIIANTMVAASVGASRVTRNADTVVALTESEDSNEIATRSSASDVVGNMASKRNVTPIKVSVRGESVILDVDIAISLRSVVSLVHLNQEGVGVSRGDINVEVVPIPHSGTSSVRLVELQRTKS